MYSEDAVYQNIVDEFYHRAIMHVAMVSDNPTVRSALDQLKVAVELDNSAAVKEELQEVVNRERLAHRQNIQNFDDEVRKAKLEDSSRRSYNSRNWCKNIHRICEERFGSIN